MEIIAKAKLEKLKRKNRGNSALGEAIDKLIEDLEQTNSLSFEQLKKVRPDADLVHNDGF